jgi:hypothetical protein
MKKRTIFCPCRELNPDSSVVQVRDTVQKLILNGTWPGDKSGQSDF